MEKILKSQVPIKILTTNNRNTLDKNSIALIKANQIDTEELIGLAEKANAKFHAIVNYSGISDVLNLLQNLNSQGFIEGSYVFINIEDIAHIKEIQSIYSNLRQGGYYVGLVNTIKGFTKLNQDDIKNINFYKMVDQDGDDSITVGDADGYINGLDIDLTGKLNQQPITRKERNTYTNVDINTDSKGWVGIGQDTVLGGGKGFGYSTMGNDFNTVISPKGIIFRRPDAERMWELLKPKQQAEISELLDHTVADEIKNQLPGLEKAQQQADSAVKFAESAVAASKVNSDAIVAQSEAISEAKAAADSAAAEIQQTKANAASDAAAIEKNVANVQADIQQAQASNASVAAQLNDVVEKAKSQDKTIKSIQDTVDGYATMIADASGNATMAKQTADSATVVARDAQHDINVLKVDAKGLHDTLTGQGNQLASLNVTLNSLDSKYLGITGDLQSKQTALGTEQQQTKDMLLNKADKSEVDSVKGTVNQVSAEQKLMANQISSKVSSAEYQTLKGKVDGLKIGGRNLLSNSETDIIVESNTTDPYPAWKYKVIYWNLTPNVQYTFSTSATNTNGVKEASMRIFNESLNREVGNANFVFPADGKRYAKTFRVPEDGTQYSIYLYAGHMGNVEGKSFTTTYHHPQLEMGNIESDYSPNPDDTITAIQKNSTAIDETNKLVSIKADKTEVNNLNNTAQQISARLNVMAGQVQSKVDETRVNNLIDGRGFTTQSTVQSLIDQRAKAITESIVNLDAKVVKEIQSITASVDGLQSNVTNFQNNTKSQFTQLSNVMQSKISSADFNALKQQVDMQTLDSADINNMKTNGHYFVRSLANSPISGWVYVDVTGNGNDRIRQDVYQDGGNQHKYRRWFGSYWTGWDEGATYTEISQLQDAVNVRVVKGQLMSQFNMEAGRTLIQSNRLYLDADSVVFSGKAFIPSAAIASLAADKVNTGWLNTNNVSLGDGRTRIRADHDYLYIQPTGSASSNTGIRMSYTGLDFLTNVIPNGYNSPVPYYSIGYDGASNGYLRISAFDHLNPGGATATQNWFAMTDAISLNNQEINFASKGNMRMQVNNGGVNIRSTLFLQNNTNNGTWVGFNRLDNSNTVEFNTGDNNGENFHVNSGARFMQYVYINGYARAQGWLTNSTLSKKTNIRKLDALTALTKIRQDEQYLYEYKRNVAKGIYDPQASFIIDDVNDVSHYSVPREFIDQSGKYREPNVELAYLIAAFQELDRQVQSQQAEIKKLKEKN